MRTFSVTLFLENRPIIFSALQPWPSPGFQLRRTLKPPGDFVHPLGLSRPPGKRPVGRNCPGNRSAYFPLRGAVQWRSSGFSLFARKENGFAFSNRFSFGSVPQTRFAVGNPKSRSSHDAHCAYRHSSYVASGNPGSWLCFFGSKIGPRYNAHINSL
jgi:hypothetical protein